MWGTISAAADHELRATVVVIGSGPAGQSVAKRLSKNGVDVLVLEAGPESEVHRKSQPLLQAAMPPVHGQYPDWGGHLLMNLGGSIGKPQIRLSADGSTPATGIRLAKLEEADLADWPISRADLDPYYDEVSAWFDLDWTAQKTPEFDDPDLKASPFHVVSRERFSHPTQAHLGSVRVVLEAPVSRLEQAPGGKITAAVVRMRNGAVRRVRGDNFVLAMNTMPATQLLMSSRLANSSGVLGRYLMDHPLVTFGYIEPSESLPQSILDQLTPQPTSTGLFWPKLVADQSAVARGDSVNVALSLIPLDWSVKVNLARHFALKPVVVGARSGARHSLDRITHGVRHRRLSKSMVRDAVLTAKGVDELLHIKFRPEGPRFNLENGWWHKELERGLPKTFEIAGMVEQRPRAENRLELSDERNVLGWRKLRATWSYDQDDKDAVDCAATPIIDALESAGFGQFTRIPPARHTENYSCHHASGTIRMSSDGATGVVDPNLQTHDHHNLFVVGKSVFPSIGFANPTLTVMALGVRLADYLSSDQFARKTRAVELRRIPESPGVSPRTRALTLEGE